MLSLVILAVYVLSRPQISLIDPIGILEIIEMKTLDLRFRLRGSKQPGDDIVIIAVDEKTEDELGRWQSSGRRWIAQMIEAVHTGGAKVIGFDLTLAEPDENRFTESIGAISSQYRELHQPDMTLRSEMLAYLENIRTRHDYDRQLADAIQDAGNVVLGVYLFFDQASAAHLDEEAHETRRRIIERMQYTTITFPAGGANEKPLRLPHVFGVEPNLPLFSEAARSFGHFTMFPDADGYIRQVPLLVEYRGGYYPSLDLEILRTYLNPALPPLIVALGQEGRNSVNGIRLGDRAIPTDSQGKFFINYYGPAQTFPHYALSDVVLGKLAPETFKDKIVLFGMTSTIYQDVHSTSFQAETYPGVEVHATIIENMLRQDFLTKPDWTLLVEPLLIGLLGIGLGIVLQRTHPFSGALAMFFCLVAVVSVVHGVFLFQKIWLNVTFPIVFLLLDYLVITTYKYFTEERKQQQIRNAFQHYVTPTVVDQMLETIDALKLGGERRVLTALFTDIRDFTGIAESMTPEDLVQFLNEFFTAMSMTVLAYEGTIDKYMGDSIMAFFGAPVAQVDHAMRACKTALDMRSHLQELQAAWQTRGLPSINIGVGVNSGEMSVGNMGSEELFDYTIMGDHVNLASRLEAINKQYGTTIVISEFTCDFLRDDASFLVRELDVVLVKGKSTPVTIYELLGYGAVDQQTQAFLAAFQQGLDAYKNRKWNQALAAFRKALQIHPHDHPSEIFVQRCGEYAQNPPPDDWDGVFVLHTK